MTNTQKSVPSVDRLVHEPARLAILSVLSGVDRADFNYLVVALGLSAGNLSSHMAKLGDAGYVAIDKAFVGGMPRTSYALTDAGRAALNAYWGQIDQIRSGLAGTERSTGRGQLQTGQ